MSTTDANADVRQCFRCKTFLPRSDFPQSHGYCRPCRTNSVREWRAANPEKCKEYSRKSCHIHKEARNERLRVMRCKRENRPPSVLEKLCTQCLCVKLADCFSSEKMSRSGLRSCCKECHRIKTAAKRNKRPERHILTLMIQRCHNQNHPKFHYWGGRGITVCDEWRDKANGFARFFEHVGPRTSSKHSIDRIDNSRGYEPGNVRWATQKQQVQNQRPRRRRAA